MLLGEEAAWWLMAIEGGGAGGRCVPHDLIAVRLGEGHVIVIGFI